VTARDWWHRTRRQADRAADVVRRVIGVPDYERYVAHVRACHPERPPLSREEFTAQRMHDRYSKPGARCC
jgi:uncharacterized short protein YbdD (DUF466 family)